MRNGRIRILWLWECLDRIGGVEILLLNLAKNIDKQRFEIIIGTNSIGDVSREFEDLGVELVKLERIQRYDWKSFFSLYRIVKNLKVDIIHTHGYYFGLRGRIIGAMTGRPTLCTYHADFSKEARTLRVRLTTRFTLPLADYVTFVSLAGESSFHNGMPMVFSEDLLNTRKYFTIYNGVEVREIDSRTAKVDRDALRKELGLNEGDRIIINVGRLSPEKGHEFLINAMRHVVEKIPEAKLVIVGDGDRREKLKKICTGLGIEKSVLFVGERKNVIEILAIADLFVYQSLWGSLGLALFEAMAVGIPVVVPKSTSVHELIEDGINGLVSLPMDAVSISSCIVKLLENCENARKIALHARADVFSRFTMEGTTKCYFSIYDYLSRYIEGK